MQHVMNDLRRNQLILRTQSSCRGIQRHFADTVWRPMTTLSFEVRVIFLAVCLFIGMFVSTHLYIVSRSTVVQIPETKIATGLRRKNIEIPVNCSLGNHTQTCPDNYYPKGFKTHDHPDTSLPLHTCPDFFRWIHEDLRPWMETGITKEMVESVKGSATFRLVILDGRAYVENYKKGIQTRDLFTQWGLLQLLRRYPGKVPDLDFMFDSYDVPLVPKKDYQQLNSTVAPPPLFAYCGDDVSYDIVFPDWSFWGWAEINMEPWDLVLKDLDKGNKRTEWIDREPYAYWKGNPWVAGHRQDLLKCNASETQDWNARLYMQDWEREEKEGFKQSHVGDQCTHRFKIYIEGSAWSVSEKYILACDSMTLMVTPYYYDFFTRGMMPLQHYWPIKMDDKCKAIKFAVKWGNNHEEKVQQIGKAASRFIQEDIKMDNVYDYMFHLLTAYSKLMKYKPTIPENATELCSETMACTSEGFVKQLMDQSTVKGPANVSPCIMQPPYDPQTLNSILGQKANSIKQVEKWEKDYFEQISPN